jgi:hypothetical protein
MTNILSVHTPEGETEDTLHSITKLCLAARRQHKFKNSVLSDVEYLLSDVEYFLSDAEYLPSDVEYLLSDVENLL